MEVGLDFPPLLALEIHGALGAAEVEAVCSKTETTSLQQQVVEVGELHVAEWYLKIMEGEEVEEEVLWVHGAPMPQLQADNRLLEVPLLLEEEAERNTKEAHHSQKIVEEAEEDFTAAHQGIKAQVP